MDFDRLRERKINFIFLGKGVLNNYQLLFNKKASKKKGVGYANVCQSNNSHVEGLIFEIGNPEILDKFEGYPKHYDRQFIEIIDAENEKVVAVAYIAKDDKIDNSLKPEQEYLDRLLTAKEFLSDKYYSLIANTEVVK